MNDTNRADANSILNGKALSRKPGGKTVDSVLLDAFGRFGGQTAFHCGSKSLSFTEVEELSRAFGAAMQSACGARKGDRIAVMMPNILEFPIVTFANLRAGLVQVNVNPLYTAKELRHQLKDSGAKTIIVASVSLPTLIEVVGDTELNTIIVVGPDANISELQSRIGGAVQIHDFREFSAMREPAEFMVPEIEQSDLAFLQYTGGTTGFAKGAKLSHGNIVANIFQFRDVVDGYLNESEEVVITAIPIYHIFALSVNTLSMFTLGAQNVLIPNPRDMDGFVGEWERHGVTFATGVNTLFNALVNNPKFAKLDFSKLKLTVGGGAPVQAAVSNKWQAITGAHLKEGFGMSETSPVVTLTPLEEEGFYGSIGVAVPETELSLRDDKNNEVELGESGELCIRGPQVMQGYWNNEAASRETMTPDGFLKSGDVAMIGEDGRLRIVDRKKDMILVSGFNVYPNEIEAAVAEIDGVLEAACVGYPNDKTGEGVALFVVPKDQDLTIDAIRGFCEQSLTKYKVPTRIVLIDALPKTTVGKILRRDLRNRIEVSS